MSNFLTGLVSTFVGGIVLTCGPGALAQSPQSAPFPSSPSQKQPHAADASLPDVVSYRSGASASGSPLSRLASSGLLSVRVTLSRTSYAIEIDPQTGAPIMPHDVTAAANVQNWPASQPLPKMFDWQVSLNWNYRKYPTHHEIDRVIFERPSPFTIDFGKQIRGGTLTVTAKTILDGHLVSGQATATVRGVNPSSKAILTAFPPTRFGLIASKVAMAESSLRQFAAAHGSDPGGMPEMSRTNDLGIMQLNAPSGSITSQDQIWDWRENVRAGLAELRDKQRMSLLASRAAAGADRVPDKRMASFILLNFYRNFVDLSPLPMPRVPDLSDRRGTGTLPDDPDVDHLALSQIERDTIRRYNGGREYAFTIEPDPLFPAIHFAGWQVDPSRGGIQARSGDLDYVRHVLRAQSGFKLPVPKPTPKKSLQKKSQKTRKKIGRAITI